MSAPWTEAHRREARALCYRLAEGLALEGKAPHGLITGHVRDAEGLREALAWDGRAADEVARLVALVSSYAALDPIESAEIRTMERTIECAEADEAWCAEGRNFEGADFAHKVAKWARGRISEIRSDAPGARASRIRRTP